MKFLWIVLALAGCGGGNDSLPMRPLSAFESCVEPMVNNQCPTRSIVPNNIRELRS